MSAPSSTGSACRATAYDAIISSGDVTHALIAARAGRNVFHIGPERDLPIFDGLGLP